MALATINTDFVYIQDKDNENVMSKEEKYESYLKEIAFQLKRIGDKLESD